MKITIRPDLEKARAIKKMIQGRKKFVKDFNGKVFSTIICENYYEIIKELATALFLSKGIKFVGEYAHKDLISETIKLMNLDESFLVFLDDLRIRRNGSLYYGEEFKSSYLINNGNKLKFMIKKIEGYLDKEIGGEI